MDQLKIQLAAIGKYGFWIASALVLLGSVGIWYMSTSALKKENDSQTKKITTAIERVGTAKDELPKQPNDLSHEAMRELIDKRRGEVMKSWEKLYNRQKDILVWPTGTFNQKFLDEFVEADGTVKLPFEHYVAFPTLPGDELETTLRQQYANYISKQLPKLAAVVDAEWTAAFDQSSAGGMEMGGIGSRRGSDTEAEIDITGATSEPLVKWSGGSQSALLGDLFPWRGQQPSTLQIYYSQENLWILRQLLEIIHEVNGDAEQAYQAKIHEITKIAIGDSVSTTPGNITKPGQNASAGGMGEDMDMEGMGMDMAGMMDMGDEVGMGGPSAGGTDAKDPAENRYRNAADEPIPGATLRTAMESNNPQDASLAVAKRVPVMMKLNMNQRAVHELVAVCGSADLMVEVNQVRVLPQSASSGGGGGGMGGMEGEEMEGEEGDMADMGGMGGMDMGGGRGGMDGGAVSGGAATDSEFPLDMSVEVYGIIYIYNPPDPVKLGVAQVTEDTVIDVATGTMGEQEIDNTPVATPPAGGTTPPAGGTTPPAGGTTPPAGGTTPPAGGTTPPAGGTTPPAGGTTPPAGGTTPPAGGTAPPVATGGSGAGSIPPVTSS